ncbi:MAG: universal stress protein [Candidatus Obscuribacterales bacterium]
MSISRIVVAIEDRLFAADIKEFLLTLSLSAGAEIKVVHAIEPTVAVETWPSQQHRQDSSDLVTWMCDSLKSALQTRGRAVLIEPVVLETFAKDAIIDTAQDWHADLIVVGSHGRRGLSRFLLGSVSQAVVAHAPCSVAVIRRPHEIDEKTYCADKFSA